MLCRGSPTLSENGLKTMILKNSIGEPHNDKFNWICVLVADKTRLKLGKTKAHNGNINVKEHSNTKRPHIPTQTNPNTHTPTHTYPLLAPYLFTALNTEYYEV